MERARQGQEVGWGLANKKNGAGSKCAQRKIGRRKQKELQQEDEVAKAIAEQPDKKRACE
jgi:hypothetical protein